MTNYKYDVAFSFLKDDEALAIQLNEILKERLNTFLYSERQKEVAGTDGEVTFNRVFGKEARIVVVLYRPNWGKTPWTRIEETAIRNRGYEDGYQFAIFVPLENSHEVPQWLPKTQIWVGIERWGIAGVASVIDARVQEYGGIPREETVEEHATRLKQQIDNEKARKQFLDSVEGVKSAGEEFVALATQIDLIAQNLSAKIGLDLVSKNDINGGALQWVEIYNARFRVCLEWSSNFSNTLNDSRLTVALLKGRPRRPNRLSFDEPKILERLLFNFDLDRSQAHGWQKVNDSEFLTTNQMAKFCVYLLIDFIHKHELGNRV